MSRGQAHRAPYILIAVMELHAELADRADLRMVAAQVHVELVVAGELPATALAVHDMHHGDVPQLHAAQDFRPGSTLEEAVIVNPTISSLCQSDKPLQTRIHRCSLTATALDRLLAGLSCQVVCPGPLQHQNGCSFPGRVHP